MPSSCIRSPSPTRADSSPESDMCLLEILHELQITENAGLLPRNATNRQGSVTGPFEASGWLEAAPD